MPGKDAGASRTTPGRPSRGEAGCRAGQPPRQQRCARRRGRPPAPPGATRMSTYFRKAPLSQAPARRAAPPSSTVSSTLCSRSSSCTRRGEVEDPRGPSSLAGGSAAPARKRLSATMMPRAASLGSTRSIVCRLPSVDPHEVEWSCQAWERLARVALDQLDPVGHPAGGDVTPGNRHVLSVELEGHDPATGRQCGGHRQRTHARKRSELEDHARPTVDRAFSSIAPRPRRPSCPGTRYWRESTRMPPPAPPRRGLCAPPRSPQPPARSAHPSTTAYSGRETPASSKRLISAWSRATNPISGTARAAPLPSPSRSRRSSSGSSPSSPRTRACAGSAERCPAIR